MSIMNCEVCNHNVDTDYEETCPICETCMCMGECDECKATPEYPMGGVLEPYDIANSR